MKKKNDAIPGRPRKRKISVLFPLLFIVPFTGWAIGTVPALYSQGKLTSFSAVLDTAARKWNSPLPVTGLVLGLCAFILFSVKYLTGDKRLEEGKEYGEARFASPDELLPYIASDPCSDKILSQNLHMDIDDRRTGLNASCLLVGGSGSGKSFRYVAPNILQANTSLVITDPKGTLLADYGNYLLFNGYRVKVININEPSSSDSFNPFSYISSSRDIVTMVNDYIRATTPKNSGEGDVFWKLAEAKLTTALIQLMFIAYPDDRSMRRFLSLVNMLEPPEKGKAPSELDRLFSDNKDKETALNGSGVSDEDRIISGRRAYENYKGIMQSAEDTCRSVIISVQSRYDSISNSPGLIKMLSGKDSVDFRGIGTGYKGDERRKTALFIISSDIDRTFAGVVLWAESTLFRELYAAADSQPSGRLPMPVQIYLDEFANVPHGDNVLQLFATARSRNISITAITQSQSQLKGLFRDESENIQGSADSFIYMGSNEPSVHRAVSEQLGKYSIHKQSTSDSQGTGGTNSRTTDSLGKDLMSPDRIRMLPSDKEIILVRGFDPVIDRKYRTQDSVRFAEAMSYGKFSYAGINACRDMSFEIPVPVDPLNGEDFNHRFFFSPDELFSLQDSAFSPDDDDDDISDSRLIALLAPTLIIERQADIDRADTLEKRLSANQYDEAQMAQLKIASDLGIDEKEILSWFYPEVSARAMEALRSAARR